ncbi:MAG: aspartyl protease family protein [Tepidiformaceae bacterium]
MTTVTTEIGRPNGPGPWETIRLLVDSGASYSVVPEAVLVRLGILPLTEQEFRLANGERIRRRKGAAAFRLGARAGGGDVVFGEPGDANLLGRFTLQSLGLALDPLKRELRELPMLL